jgi:hypothetical protein
LWGERVGFVQSYWGLFGGVSVPMSSWAYFFFNCMAALSLVGLVAFLVRQLRKSSGNTLRWPQVVLTLLWIPAVVLPLIFGWTRYTLASQGRLIFSAIGSLSLWFMVGLGGALPDRWGKIATAAGASIMGIVAIAAPFVSIEPHYAIQAVSTQPQVSTDIAFTPPGSAAPAMKLVGYSLQESNATPGDTAHVTLYWESLSAMDRDWSVFIHLQDGADLIQAQRDTYPGLGLIATRDLQPGFHWADRYAIPISPSAYSPETLRVIVGLYDLQTEQRMILPYGSDSATLGEISLTPRPSTDNIPNPVDYDFGGQLTLAGYEIDHRRVRPGDAVTLTLLWRALQPVSQDYTLSVQVFDKGGEKRGQIDQPLTYRDQTTSHWRVGDIARNRWTVQLSPETQPGAATIQLVVYWIDATGELRRLQLVTADGRLSDPFLALAKIQVAP